MFTQLQTMYTPAKRYRSAALFAPASARTRAGAASVLRSAMRSALQRRRNRVRGDGVVGRLSGVKSRVIREMQHKHVIKNQTSSHMRILIQTTDAGLSQWYGTASGGFAASGASLSMSFSLSGIQIFMAGTAFPVIATPGIQQYTGLYDEYRIDRVKVTMYVGNDASFGSVVNQGGFTVAPIPTTPVFLAAIDSDDANNTTTDELLQFSTVQQIQPTPGKPAEFMIKPCAQQQFLQNAIGGVNYGRVYSPNLDMGNTGTAHYGLKINPLTGFAFGPAGTVAQQQLAQFVFTYYVTMKGTR